MDYIIIEWKIKFFNYLTISNIYTKEIFPTIKPVKPKCCYFWASNKERWKVICIITVIPDWIVLYFNIVMPLVAWNNVLNNSVLKCLYLMSFTENSSPNICT